MRVRICRSVKNILWVWRGLDMWDSQGLEHFVGLSMCGIFLGSDEAFCGCNEIWNMWVCRGLEIFWIWRGLKSRVGLIFTTSGVPKEVLFVRADRVKEWGSAACFLRQKGSILLEDRYNDSNGIYLGGKHLHRQPWRTEQALLNRPSFLVTFKVRRAVCVPPSPPHGSDCS